MTQVTRCCSGACTRTGSQTRSACTRGARPLLGRSGQRRNGSGSSGYELRMLVARADGLHRLHGFRTSHALGADFTIAGRGRSGTGQKTLAVMGIAVVRTHTKNVRCGASRASAIGTRVSCAWSARKLVTYASRQTCPLGTVLVSTTCSSNNPTVTERVGAEETYHM
eukprot:scaffold1890_cov380-Prasinococcus_capsulatus_cf.AAC.16